MSLHDPFDVISSVVDLDDPAEHDNAQRFMADALGRVIKCLPGIAHSAASTAKQHLEGWTTADEVLAVRLRLWESIRGRVQSDEPDVLRIRTAICALHGMDVEPPCDKLEYFLMFWQRSGLSMTELCRICYRAKTSVPFSPMRSQRKKLITNQLGTSALGRKQTLRCLQSARSGPQKTVQHSEVTNDERIVDGWPYP